MMKKTAATLALLAGLGGCASTDNTTTKKDPAGGFGTVSRGQQVPGVVGPNGEPIMMAAARGSTPGGVTQAGGTTTDSSKVQQVALFTPYGSAPCTDCNSTAHVPGTSIVGGEFMAKYYSIGNGNITQVQAQQPFSLNQGISPVYGQGPPGAVAAVGALPFAGRGAIGVINGRSSIKFTGPAGMKITWQLPTGGFNPESSGLTAPKEYNFLQGQTYRLRLTQILPNFPGRAFYPTLEVAPSNPKSLTFLAHSSVPLTFTNEDFEQARSGNLVVKVIYLPDRENQDFATVAGAEELVSTRLEPGADPVAEAQRKGTILAVVRLGNIDLENQASPAMTAPPPSMVPHRPGPIILPGPAATTPGVSSLPSAPGVSSLPAAPTKPIPPIQPTVPAPKASTSSSSGSGGSATPPTLPGGLGGSGSGLPAILPPTAPVDTSVPTTLPPIK